MRACWQKKNIHRDPYFARLSDGSHQKVPDPQGSELFRPAITYRSRFTADGLSVDGRELVTSCATRSGALRVRLSTSACNDGSLPWVFPRSSVPKPSGRRPTEALSRCSRKWPRCLRHLFRFWALDRPIRQGASGPRDIITFTNVICPYRGSLGLLDAVLKIIDARRTVLVRRKPLSGRVRDS